LSGTEICIVPKSLSPQTAKCHSKAVPESLCPLRVRADKWRFCEKPVGKEPEVVSVADKARRKAWAKIGSKVVPPGSDGL